MFKKIKSLLVTFIVLSFGSENVLCDYDKQPKVLMKNGDLVLEAAYDRNITLRLTGDASLFLNNVNVMDKILQPDDESKQLEVFSTDKIETEIQKLNHNLMAFTRTLMALQRRTSRSLQPNAIRRNLGRINRLSSRLMVLERRLKTDECAEATEPCKNGGTCYDSYNGFICECTEGYTGKTCEEYVDQCYLLAGTDLGCQNNAICINTPGSYRCICAKGFSGTHCRLRNVVCHQIQSQELCGHGTCVPANNEQGYTCICEQGWRQNNSPNSSSSGSLLSLACDVDVNECEEPNNPCDSECINLPGSFKCGPCPAGYTGNGVTCLDIDECATDNGGCSTLPKVRCINAEGSYVCGSCPPGWVGDGHTCDLAPSNSCDEEHICHPQAKCEYISDVASCTCPPGMFGHGFGPRGCHTSPLSDSCAGHLCQNNGTCVASGRTTSCICREGYSGALCEIADGCHPNPCQNEGTCKPLGVNGFKCSCVAGTTGKHCELLRSVCARNLRRPSGSLKYPSDDATEYSVNERCAWIIRTSPQQILNVTFSRFDVEESEDCTRDFLQIHDGNSLASQLIGRFCGNKLPLGGNILSSHHLLFFWFRSDNATNRPGFEMSWVSQAHVCGDELEVSYKDAGVVKSPGYPGKTPINRECLWVLSAPYGYRFVLRIYEVTLGMLPNCTGDTLQINDADLVLKRYCGSSNSEVLRSSSNKISLHLHTNRFGVDSSFQLHYEVESGIPHCGGLFTEPSGYIVGPLAQATCLYLIQQPAGTQIKWEFLDFISSEVANCNFNSIEIFDGKADESAKLLVACGGNPPEPVISSGNYMLIRYKNALADESQGTTPLKAKYSRVCDFRVFGPDPGVLSTPNYPKPYVEHITCTFRIYGPAGTVVFANFTDFSIAETGTNHLMDPVNDVRVNSSRSRNEVNKLDNDGDDDDDDSLTYVDIFLSNTKKERFLKGEPILAVSEYNEMKVVFHATTNSGKARGLRIEYSFKDMGCGGVYTEDKGSLDEMVNVEQCVFIFEAAQGKHIKLELEYAGSSEFLIYANETGGRDYLLKNATGLSKIQETFNFNTITLLLKSGIKITGRYEFANTAQACGGNFSSLYGAVISPSWPRSYQANLDCVWIITAPLGNKIELQVHNFTLEPTCSGDILEIRNGKFSNSPLIGRYCGSQIPSRLVSFANSLYIRFTTDKYIEGPGFYFNWEQTTTGCGGKLTAYKGSIHTPHFDTLAETMAVPGVGMMCDWQIVVSQGSSINLSVTSAMEELEFCHKNNLKIYDGSSTLSPLLPFNCSEIMKGGHMQLKSSSNKLLIVYFLTQNSKYVTPEFMLDYETNCRSVIDQHRGVIESPNFPENYPENQNCVWDLKAGRNNKMKLQFSHLSLEVLDMMCEYDYVEVWDMQDMDVLKKHHLCVYAPEPIISEGNRLMLHFVSDYSNNKNGFRAEYSRVGCGEHMDKEYGRFESPNYPFSNDVDCDWFIELEPGKQIQLSIVDFHIDSGNTDCDQNILYVKETKDSSIELARECHERQAPLVVTSPANRLYIHFHTSPTRSRKYFKAYYYTKQSTCGGVLQGTFGVISSSNYPNTPSDQALNCVWDITVPEPHGIQLNFKHFELTDSPNCTEAYMEFFKVESGGSKQHLGKFCGSEKPNIKLVHSNTLRVEYKDSGKPSLGTFLIEYKKQCGGLITKSAGYMKSFATEECVWEFDVAPGTLISLNILQLDCHCQMRLPGVDNCINTLVIKENDFDKYLKFGMTMCEKHQTDLVFETSKLTIFAKNIGFRAKYSTVQHSCGGTIESGRGSLASPFYPSTYPPNVDCNWILQGSKGSFLELQFEQLDLVDSERCNEDYLEIRNWSEGKVLGIYCGSKMPEQTIVSYERAWLRFHSADGNTAKGFKLSWNYAHLNELVNMTKGYIANPPLQMVEQDEEPYAWRIIVPRGQFIELKFDEYNSGLTIFDGFDQAALSVDVMPSPWRFVSSSNVVYLQTDNGNIEKFIILWNSLENKPLDENATLSKCHSEEVIKVYRNNAIRIFSPGYPKGYENGLTCDWILKPANVIEHVAVALLEVDLEVTGRCTGDYLQISTSADLMSWNKQERLCNKSAIRKPSLWIHGTPHIKLDFVTDWSINGTGFLAKVVAKCGSNMTDSVGFIDGSLLYHFNDGPNSQCMWHVNVKPGKRIHVRLDYRRVALGKDDFDDKCSNHALLYDGVDDHAPLIPPGRICFPQNVTSILINSTSNHLTIKYNLNLSQISPRLMNMEFWNLTYREYSECNEEIRLIPEAPDTVITSPLYPNIPHAHTECVWRVVAPQGEIIQIEFVDRFDMSLRYCAQEYVELFDGATSLSRKMGRYCRKPPVLRTTQNMLYVHYLTDIAEPRNGFKALVSINRCGGTFSDNYGTVKSPGYPAAYPSNAVCDFVINLKGRSVLRLNFVDINLPYNETNLKFSDHLEIVTITNADIIIPPILVYGNTTKNAEFQILSNKAIVRFRSFLKTYNHRGFSLKYYADGPYCSNVIEGVSGLIMMNLLSKPLFQNTCTWKITVPKNQRVRLEFLNMEDLKQYNFTTPLRFNIYNSFEWTSEITAFSPHTFSPQPVIQSTDNKMYVKITIPKTGVVLRPLKARYSSNDESSCPHDIDLDNKAGSIELPGWQLGAIASFYCGIKLRLSEGETIVFNISTLSISGDGTFSSQHAVAFLDNFSTTYYRNNLTDHIHAQSQRTGSIKITQNALLRINSLKMTYQKYSCGGVVPALSGKQIQYPQMTTVNEEGSIFCVWTLNNPYFASIDGISKEKLLGNFSFTESCENEYVQIVEGQWTNRTAALKICKDKMIDNFEYLIVKRFSFVVYYSTRYNPEKPAFSFRIANSLTCSSETMVDSSTYPITVDKSSYKNNQECSWIFHTSVGLYLQLKFMGRFFIEDSVNCSKDYLEVQRDNGGVWLPEARFCGREVPALYNSTSSRLQIIFRTDEAITADGFQFIVQTNCRLVVNVTSTEPRIITSPKNAVAWRLMHCEYIFQTNETDKLIVVKAKFDTKWTPVLSRDSCRLGMLTVFKRNENAKDLPRVLHCELEFEERAHNYLRFEYDAHIGQRFTLEYSFDSCGGNLTAPAVIRPLKHETENTYADNMNCVWYVTAPPEHSIAIRFKYFSLEESYDKLTIYSGYTMKPEKLVARLSGNYSSSAPIVIDNNRAVINAVSDGTHSSRGFEANIIFLANCNERISLGEGNSPVTLARNMKVNSSEEYICNYRLTAPKAYRIRIKIKKLQINGANSTCLSSHASCEGNCNVLEIFDSPATFEEGSAKFCSSSSINRTFVSSVEFASLRLTANQPGQYSFEIILKMEHTECGRSEYQLGTNEKLKFTFPTNGLSHYPSNVHCTWSFVSDKQLQFHFNYIDLQNRSQATGKCLDYVTVKNIYYVHNLCGRAENFSINGVATSRNVGVTFHSDDSEEGKGFEFIVQRADACNRTYNFLSMSVTYRGNGWDKTVCNDTIVVPENYTLNFFIHTMYFKNYDCTTTHLRITDLKTNQILLDRCQNTYSNVDLFTTTNAVRVEASDFSTINFDYVASSRNLTPGCGGTLTMHEAQFSSPPYENNRNFSDCRWDIIIPTTTEKTITFFDFNMGAITNCHLDNVKIIEVLPNKTEKLLKTLCGPDIPKLITSSSDHLVVISKKSPNFDGTGWTLRYSSSNYKDYERVFINNNLE